MLFARRPITGFFTGLLYFLFWKKDDNKPPYWGSVITWTQTGNNSKNIHQSRNISYGQHSIGDSS